MSDTKKFLDYEGVKHLWSKVNMQDYPNNETLITVINAIDETKADKTELFSGSYNDLTDIPNTIDYIQPEEPEDAPDGTLWIDTDEKSDSIISIPNIQFDNECIVNEKFMGKQIYQAYFELTDFPTAGTTKYIESKLFDSIDTVLELTGTFNKNGLLVGSFSYGGNSFSLGFDYQQYNGATKKIFIDNKNTSTYFDTNTTAIIKLKYTKVK